MRKEHRTLLLQIFLFVATFFTTTTAGLYWVYGKFYLTANAEGEIVWNDQFFWNDFLLGTNFSVPFLLILTIHEFGHYFVAAYHRVKATLPFYIPFPPLPIDPFMFSIGTMGALIRIREKVRSTIQNFDIGLAGPLAGFIAAVAIIAYGFFTLPPAEAIFEIHPEYKPYGLHYADSVYSESYLKKHGGGYDITIGSNLLFEFFKSIVPDQSRVPNEHEMMHSPLLLAGFFALFFTSLNLFPMGQLDGGHIVYGLFGGKWHRRIASGFFIAIITFGGVGMVSIHDTPKEWLPLWIGGTIFFYYYCFARLEFPERDRIMIAVLVFGVQFVVSWLFPQVHGNPTWVLFSFLVTRFTGLQHPPSEIEQPLDTRRIILGWVALFIFVISFSPRFIEINLILP
jgi:membrane-associated protease RseP (regulator of RpoE activity)